ncbi:MAG: redox-regulated ATPase YchF [Vampirovibrionales bacterium]|nr:redox-regulated ATPase YchF [Vampirovibrionales bacterium]
MLKAGIVGLPNVGKSTLFNALTSSYQAESANYPFCTIEPNIGIVKVPDERLGVLQKLAQTNVVIPAVFEFADIAGLVKGASKGEGLGNQFLANIREVDAIVHVVRCFEDDDIIHVDNSVDPIRDIETIHVELCMADADSLAKRIERLKKAVKSQDKKSMAELSVFEKILPIINEAGVVDEASFSDEDRAILRQSQLLSGKPVIYAANVSESELADPTKNPHYQKLLAFAKEEGREVVPISAQIEAELSILAEDERKDYLESLGVASSGIDQLIQASFRTLGLVSYFTAGVKEVRAWPFPSGYTAPQCAGVIHSDFEKGFIRAEVIGYNDYVTCAGEKGAKEKGLMRLEGKEYLMKDGDVVHFRFNV